MIYSYSLNENLKKKPIDLKIFKKKDFNTGHALISSNALINAEISWCKWSWFIKT